MDATVIVPNYNRGDALLQTLQMLACVDYPPDAWEVVVVDDGSTDGTEAAVEAWIRDEKMSVRFLRQANAGPAAARNRGAATARGKYLVFIDNDILVSASFLRDHVATLTAHPGCWVVGRITHPDELRRTPFGRYRDALWERFHATHGSEEPADTNGISAANLSLPRADFERFGGFDTDFTIASSEDWDLGFRARQAGVRVLYHPGIVVLHNDWAVSLPRFCERQRLYSKSDVLLWRKYGAASPRDRLVRANGPIRWREDSFLLMAKKAVKRGLACAPCRGLVNWTGGVLEKVTPDSRLSHRAYDLAVALAIFRGVREGWEQYPAAAPPAAGAAGLTASKEGLLR